MVAVLVRSTPIALAICLIWFGPIENVIGEGRAWADRWFPGLLLRSMLQPDTPGSIATGTAVATLAVYAGVCVGVIAVVMSRRDVGRAEAEPSTRESGVPPHPRPAPDSLASGRAPLPLRTCVRTSSSVMMRPHPGPVLTH